MPWRGCGEGAWGLCMRLLVSGRVLPHLWAQAALASCLEFLEKGKKKKSR